MIHVVSPRKPTQACSYILNDTMQNPKEGGGSEVP